MKVTMMSLYIGTINSAIIKNPLHCLKALEPVDPGIVVPGEVDRVRGVRLRLPDEGAVAQLGFEPVNLQVVDLQAGILAVPGRRGELCLAAGLNSQL